MKRSYIIGLLIIAACIGILVSVTGKTSEYADFGMARNNPGKEFHVVGVWDKVKGLSYDPAKDPNYFAFPLKDNNGNEVNVVLHNNKPQDFEHSEKIVVVGKMNGEEFQASEILMKCPSKYTQDTVRVKSL